MSNSFSDDLKKTKGSFQSKSNKLSNTLNGEEYLRLVNTVNRSWHGEEADNFLQFSETESSNSSIIIKNLISLSKKLGKKIQSTDTQSTLNKTKVGD